MRTLLVLVAVTACSGTRHDDRAPVAVAPAAPAAALDAPAAPVDAVVAVGVGNATMAPGGAVAEAGGTPPDPVARRVLLEDHLSKLEPLMVERQVGTSPSLSTSSMAGELGPRTADEINRVIRSHAGTVRACYARELKRDPTLAGRLVVSFTIAAAGTVERAAIDAGRSTLADEAVRACVVRQVQGFRFPPSNAVAHVNYPFIFSAG